MNIELSSPSLPQFETSKASVVNGLYVGEQSRESEEAQYMEEREKERLGGGRDKRVAAFA